MSEKDKIPNQVLYIIGVFVLLLVIFVFAWPIQFLWNNVLVDVLTCCRNMTYWQAVGFEVFAYMLGRIMFIHAKIEKND